MIINKFTSFIQNGFSTISRYPLVFIASVISAIGFILEIEHNTTEVMYSRIAITATLGISLFFTISMSNFSKNTRLNWGLNLMGIGILLFYYFFILPEDFDSTNVKDSILNISFFIISHLLATFLPFLVRKDKDEAGFWEYNKNLLIYTILSAFFIGVFTIGINLAVFSVEKLFNLDFSHKVYTYFSIFSSIVGHTFVFLSFVGNGYDSLKKTSSDYPTAVKFFTQFILIPLIIIYGFILYLYSGKILLQWDLPQGWVSYMVIAYTSVGLLAYVLVYPLVKNKAKSWVKFFFRIFHYSILPLLVLLFVAISTRFLTYGFTENRYFVFLYAIWISVIALYFVFYKKAVIRFIPISLAIFIIISICLPYYNVFSVSIRSQKNHFEKVLADTKILKNGKIDFTKKIKNDDANNIADIIEYLAKRDQKDYILTYIPQNKKETLTKIFNQKYYSYWDIKEEFSNVISNDNDDFINNHKTIKLNKSILLHKKYDYFIRAYHYDDSKYPLKDKDYLTFNYEKITLHSNEKEYTFNYKTELIDYINKNKDLDNPEPIQITLGDYHLTIPSDIRYYLKENQVSDIDLDPEIIILIQVLK